MKEFKCLEGASEVTCHVPYPYRNPQAIDLDHISAPSDKFDITPYTPDLRVNAAPGAQWIDHLLIESPTSSTAY